MDFLLMTLLMIIISSVCAAISFDADDSLGFYLSIMYAAVLISMFMWLACEISLSLSFYIVAGLNLLTVLIFRFNDLKNAILSHFVHAKRDNDENETLLKCETISQDNLDLFKVHYEKLKELITEKQSSPIYPVLDELMNLLEECSNSEKPGYALIRKKIGKYYLEEIYNFSSKYFQDYKNNQYIQESGQKINVVLRDFIAILKSEINKIKQEESTELDIDLKVLSSKMKLDFAEELNPWKKK